MVEAHFRLKGVGVALRQLQELHSLEAEPPAVAEEELRDVVSLEVGWDDLGGRGQSQHCEEALDIFLVLLPWGENRPGVHRGGGGVGFHGVKEEGFVLRSLASLGAGDDF